MLLAIDIGNSSIKFGFYNGEILISRFAIPTIRGKSGEELYHSIKSRLVQPPTGVIVSSVVPELDQSVSEFSQKHLGTDAVFVTNDFDFGFPMINYNPVLSLGTDRLIAASAAVRKYGKPCIVCDFGTATTIDCVDSGGIFLGGIITPGMNLLADALSLWTSKLPRVTLEKPQNVIGNSTNTALQSGIFYGYLGLIEGILARIFAEIETTPMVIATGGFANLVAENCDLIDNIYENLILDGLNLLHTSNRIKI